MTTQIDDKLKGLRPPRPKAENIVAVMVEYLDANNEWQWSDIVFGVTPYEAVENELTFHHSGWTNEEERQEALEQVQQELDGVEEDALHVETTEFRAFYIII